MKIEMKVKIYSSLGFIFLLLFEYADHYSVFAIVKENYAGYKDFKLSELNTYRECLSNQRCFLGSVISLVGGGGFLISLNNLIKNMIERSKK